MIQFISIGSYETFEAISRRIRMKNHRDFLNNSDTILLENNQNLIKN